MRTLFLYVVVGVVYVVIGVAFPQFLYSSVVAAVFLIAGVWAVPAALRRLVRMRGSA